MSFFNYNNKIINIKDVLDIDLCYHPGYGLLEFNVIRYIAKLIEWSKYE